MTPGLGKYVVGLRTARGLTQTALSEIAGLSRSHMQQIESGKIGLPNADIRRRLASALGVSHLDLLVAAGEITREELGTVAGIVERAPDDPVDAMCRGLRAVQWRPDRLSTMQGILRMWLESDAKGG